MMTSGLSKGRRRAAAFTLLEMITVMAVMMLMLGIASFAMREASPDPSVRKPGDELIRLSKTAVRASAIQGRGFAISFDRSGFSLLTDQSGQSDRVNLPKGMKVSIKRWGARQWEDADGHRWWFGSQGLCEPLSVRLTAQDSALMMKFNPLTGTPSEEEMEMF